MYNCNLDDAVEHVKTIVENNRCVFCDQLNVSFVRYPCGHSTCSKCFETAEACFLCLTQPDAPAHFVDEPSSKRVRNASELLIAFQDLFQIDVYRRHRVSEKLKLEKQFFPECIQASTKYCNKRKSLVTIGKENKRFSSLPGETISSNKFSKMENTVNYVEKWLNKNESVQNSHKNLPRKPFTDLNVNQTNNKEANNVSLQTSIKKSVGRKRTHLKIIKSDTSNVLGTASYKRIKNNSNIKEWGIEEVNKKNKKCENNESGIFIDDEIIDIDDSPCEIIDIDDSQHEVMDKDRLACLEVLQAEKNNDSIDCGVESSINEHVIRTKDNFDEPNKSQDALKTYKVPFFWKSTLVDVSNLSRSPYLKADNFKDITKTTQTSKNITVTIDNESFVTTIKVSNLDGGASCSKKQSTAAQTDNVSDTVIFSDKPEHNVINEPTNVIDEVKVMDIKTNESYRNKQTSKRKCLIIEESDTDSDLTDDNINSLEVTADIHQTDTYIDNGVLCELEPNEYEHRSKHAARELTPLSSDSSDKENYDPNRIKRQKLEKKNCTKK